MRTRWLVLFTAAFFTLLASRALAHAAVEVGQTAPPLIVRQMDGKAFDLAALKGQVTLVHFWATWCAPCKEEMPVLNSFYQRHHAEGLEMVAVSADSPRHRDDVRDAMTDFSFPAAMLGDADANGFGKPTAIPITYVLDKQGIVRVVMIPDESTLTEKQLEDVVTPLMGQ